MTQRGLEIANQFGKKLPSFANQAKAEEYFFAYKDNHLSILAEIASKQTKFLCDYSPESLKNLELWYFELYENDSFYQFGVDREIFERCMAMYFGEVMIKNIEGAHWIIEEYAFTPSKYELGVNKGLGAVMLNRWTDHFETPNNKRKQSIYREYKKFAEV